MKLTLFRGENRSSHISRPGPEETTHILAFSVTEKHRNVLALGKKSRKLCEKCAISCGLRSPQWADWAFGIRFPACHSLQGLLFHISSHTVDWI